MDLHHFRQDYLENLIINNKIHWWNAVLVLNIVRSSSLQTNSKVRNAFYQWMVVFMIKISIQSCLISYVYIVICFLRSCSCDFIHLDNRLSLFNSACGQLTYVWRSAVFYWCPWQITDETIGNTQSSMFKTPLFQGCKDPIELRTRSFPL